MGEPTLREPVLVTAGIFARRPPITHEALNLVGSNLRIPIDRARRELGYEPKVSYEEAMAELSGELAARI